MVTVRAVRPGDLPQVWTLTILPNIGETADRAVPLPLPAAPAPPPGDFADVGDPQARFVARGGCFLVAVTGDGHVVGTGGFRPVADHPGRLEVLRVRVHPALRRQGIGRALLGALEARGRDLGFHEAWLDTATNQPEAMAFYRSLGYREVGRTSHPDWHWTLAYHLKPL
ncbi:MULTISPECIES: GNAT family N-acetyltransferase [unclassified Streptomyces]|uniref:GNAT family N-acetyltransferase n=1 Tax=unclassified Streptomyces TaxID=2593676 RepID=UPI000B874DCD|nr:MULTISPECIES: GNAT family N-acetyltransferase [unclassified Streptomyces]MYS21938.1 GNAT family N-acetyltransferase [Streptomyces sp. SID4948]